MEQTGTATHINLLRLAVQVVQLFIRFLYRLASLNKDYAVVMCRLGTKEALVKALDKHSTNLQLVTELRDLISDCEKYASLYKKMTTSVLAGCIQVRRISLLKHKPDAGTSDHKEETEAYR